MRFPLLLAGVLIAGSIMLPNAATADDTAAALLSKHKAYVGWEFGDGTFKTLRLHERWTRNGRADDETLASLSVVEAGPIYRAETDDRDGSISKQALRETYSGSRTKTGLPGPIIAAIETSSYRDTPFSTKEPHRWAARCRKPQP